VKKKTLPKLKSELQTVFNKFIRERDSEDGWFTCIACGKTLSIKYMNAGHYYPVKGYDGIRYDELNVNGECQGCNCFDKAHLIGYGINLEEKIGKELIEELHKKALHYKQNGNKFLRYEIEEQIKLYKELIGG